jgi:hypothetical protein
MNPRIISLMTRAYERKRKHLDELVWASIGSYIIPAITVAVDRCLNGNKSKAEYTKQNMFNNIEDEYLTDEEREKRELEQLIANEEAWIRASKQRGLPETII